MMLLRSLRSIGSGQMAQSHPAGSSFKLLLLIDVPAISSLAAACSADACSGRTASPFATARCALLCSRTPGPIVAADHCAVRTPGSTLALISEVSALDGLLASSTRTSGGIVLLRFS